MTKYALIVGDAVAGVSDDLENDFHPDLAATFVEVPDSVEVGFIRGEDGVFAAPPPAVFEPVEEQSAPRVLTRLEFLRLFTREERVSLTQVRNTDPMVGDFLMMLELAESVSFEDGDITSGIKYLVAKKFLTQNRADEILGV